MKNKQKTRTLDSFNKLTLIQLSKIKGKGRSDSNIGEGSDSGTGTRKDD